jgi:hypothetical protein
MDNGRVVEKGIMGNCFRRREYTQRCGTSKYAPATGTEWTNSYDLYLLLNSDSLASAVVGLFARY